MAHFAKLDENNIVLDVIVISNDEILDDNNVEQESLGIARCQELFGNDTNWKQTSYNNNIRGVYAGVGFKYISDGDYFQRPQPFPSWVFSTDDYNWHSPIGDCPDVTADDNFIYYWDEDAYQADNTTGWVKQINSE